MSIAVGGNVGAILNIRDALLNTQTILSNSLKFPTAVSAWNTDEPLKDGPTGLTGNPVEVKANYPINNRGNGFVENPTYVITDLNGNVLPNFTVNIQTGTIFNSAYTGTDSAGKPLPVGLVQFQVTQSGLEAAQMSQIDSISNVINNLTSVVGMYQNTDMAWLNSGAIS